MSIQKTDIIKVAFLPQEHDIIKAMAEEAWLGSDDSQIATHGTQQHDPAQYRLDQIAGQYGELALHKFFFGSTEGLKRYYKQRVERNENKYAGDDGSDLWFPEKPEYRADAKTTTMRRSQDPLTYNLIVRPRDFHEDTNYVLLLRPKRESFILLVGWCNTSDLPDEVNTGGLFRGAYTKPAIDLTPMNQMRM